MRRAAIALLACLLFACLAAPAMAGSQRAVLRSAMAWQTAFQQGNLDAACQGLSPTMRRLWAESYSQLLHAQLDCPQGIAAMLEAYPWLDTRDDPALTARLRRLELRTLSRGKVKVSKSLATISVRYQAPGCRHRETWRLRRQAGRWFVEEPAEADRSCYSRPATVAEAEAARAALRRQNQAIVAGDVVAYCAATDPVSWFSYSLVLQFILDTLTGDCQQDLQAAWDKSGKPSLEYLQAVGSRIETVSWRIRDRQMWSALFTVDVQGCKSRARMQAVHGLEEWLVELPSEFNSECKIF